MNKDSDSECRSQIIIQKKCYSLYINKDVDEKIQQADACCVWRAAKNFARQFFFR